MPRRPLLTRWGGQLEVDFHNPGPTYLGAGDSPLPTLFLLSSLAFSLLLLGWVVLLCRNREEVGASPLHSTHTHTPSLTYSLLSPQIHLIHHLMSLLLVFKVFSLVFQSVMMHFIKTRGHTVGWNVLYYVFAFLRGMLLFVVILLIGAGWSLVKVRPQLRAAGRWPHPPPPPPSSRARQPFLSAREKSVLVFVLALQVLDNVALVAVEEAVPGSQAFVRWISSDAAPTPPPPKCTRHIARAAFTPRLPPPRLVSSPLLHRNLLHIVDIVCCCAILFPIVWSIRTLSASAASDGRLSLALLKLRQFRQFYVLVVVYVYFTRIVVFLIESNLNYRLTWMGQLCTEGAAFFFYAFAGCAGRSLPQEGVTTLGRWGWAHRLCALPLRSLRRLRRWKFRPMADNPYLRIAGDEDAAVEEEEGAEQERRELEMEVRRDAGEGEDERRYDIDHSVNDEEDEEAGEAYADVAARGAGCRPGADSPYNSTASVTATHLPPSPPPGAAADRVGTSGETAHLTSLPTVESDSEGEEGK